MKFHRAIMDRYLSIVEEHSNAAATIDEAKLKQFLAHTKVSEYARITEQDFRDMSAADRFALLQGYYSFMNKVQAYILLYCLAFSCAFLTFFSFQQLS